MYTNISLQQLVITIESCMVEGCLKITDLSYLPNEIIFIKEKRLFTFNMLISYECVLKLYFLT